MATIKTITLKNGSKRYRFVVDVGRDPETGKRRQETHTFTQLKEAKAELSRVGHQVSTRTYVRPSKITVNEVCDNYLKSAANGAEAATESSYRHALKPARERLGDRQAQSITRQDIEKLRDWMMSEGRKRGGKPGTGVGARSVRLTLGRLGAAFEQAVEDGQVTRNPVRGRKLLPTLPKEDQPIWSTSQVREFIEAAAGDRLHAAWRLSLYGLRREEVCGLRWQDVDLAAGRVTIAVVRVVVDGKAIDKDCPKSERGKRTLPLDAADVAALQALADRQATEAMEAPEAYSPSGRVVCDELGAAVNPEWYTDEFHRLRERAGLPRITLRNVRTTANSLMADMGVPDHIRAAWCGHTVAVNVSTYTVAHPETLAVAGGALSKLYNPV